MLFVSLASGSEFKENYYKNFPDIISLLGSNSNSPIREVDTFRIIKNVIRFFCNMIKLSIRRGPV